MSAYTKFTQYVSKHALLSTLVMILALGTVGVSAAQLIGPESIKPFKTAKSENKSSDTSVSSSIEETEKDIFKQTLFADNDNELSTLEKCNLRVKYSKVITLGTGTEKVKVSPENSFQQFNNQYSKTSLPAIEGLGKYYIQLSEEPLGFGPGIGFSTFCFNGEYKFSEFNSKFSNNEENGFVSDSEILGKIEYTSITKSELCKSIGLNSKCNDISNVLKIVRPGADGGSTFYYFSYNSKTYIFELENLNNIKLQSEFIS